jgi:hypothetical protein
MMTRRQVRPRASDSSLLESASVASCEVSVVSATSLGSSSSDVFGGSSVSLIDYTTDDENGKVDDDALNELIRKLRGQTAGSNATADSPSVAATESADGTAGLEDDLIEKHLKALAKSTSTKRGKAKKANKKSVAAEETEDYDESYQDNNSEVGSNVMGDDDDGDDDALSDDDTDDESQASVDYEMAEHIVKQLGVMAEDGSQDHKRLLQSMVQSSTKFDYQGAPKTATTQRAWLTSLAKDLLREDSGSDNEDDASSVGLVKYEANISNLTKAGENAQKLIDSSTKQQEKLARWREKHRAQHQPQFHARKPKHLLKASDIEAKLLSAPITDSTTTSIIDQKVHDEGRTSVPNFSDIDSVFTPVDRIIPDELTVLHHVSTLFPTLMQPVRPTAEIVVPIIPKKQRKASGKKKADLKVIVEAAKEERSRAKALPKDVGHSNNNKAIDKRDSPATSPEVRKAPSIETHVAKVEAVKDVKGNEVKKEVSNRDQTAPETSKEVSKRDQAAPETSKEVSNRDQAAPETPKVLPPLVIPSGMPPYPGFGPKWPWHPYSARAPPGYRECYMHHMGDSYFSYMEYLRTRAETGDENDVKETQHEKILRISLREEAKFKKPKPAVCPYTFTAKPGRARENCAVGGGGAGKGGGGLKVAKKIGGGGVIATMPKIEEGSNSSSSRASSETNSFEKKIQQKKTQPDVVTVGKYHPKAKGRKAKIVVVSGAELDRQAKQNKKAQQQQKKPDSNKKLAEENVHNAAKDQPQQQQQHQQQEKKMPDNSSTKNLVEAVTLSTHSAKDRTAAVEQPHHPVESRCMCVIM